MTAKIFKRETNLNLDQLRIHIKNTLDLTNGQNKKLIDTLTSLQDAALYWKQLAKSILKIRPISVMNPLEEHKESVELFCICRQPENADMLCCDFCETWFHYPCIGISSDTRKNLDKVKYKCIGCAIREGKTSAAEVS